MATPQHLQMEQFNFIGLLNELHLEIKYFILRKLIDKYNDTGIYSCQYVHNIYKKYYTSNLAA